MRCIGVSADASENRERAPKTIRGAVAGASRAARGLLFFAATDRFGFGRSADHRRVGTAGRLATARTASAGPRCAGPPGR